MTLDEAFRLTENERAAAIVHPGDRCSGPLSLREAGRIASDVAAAIP